MCERVILGEILQALEGPMFTEWVDFWVCSNDFPSTYSVRLAFSFLHKRDSEVNVMLEEIMVSLLLSVWESWSPLKAKVFS